MKKLMITAALIASTVNAQAADWRQVTSNKNGASYIDANTLKRGNGRADAWVMTEYSEEFRAQGNTTGYIIHMSYNCTNLTATELYVLYQGKNGAEQGKARASKIIAPGTVDEIILNAACGRQS